MLLAYALPFHFILLFHYVNSTHCFTFMPPRAQTCSYAVTSQLSFTYTPMCGCLSRVHTHGGVIHITDPYAQVFITCTHISPSQHTHRQCSWHINTRVYHIHTHRVIHHIYTHVSIMYTCMCSSHTQIQMFLVNTHTQKHSSHTHTHACIHDGYMCVYVMDDCVCVYVKNTACVCVVMDLCVCMWWVPVCMGLWCVRYLRVCVHVTGIHAWVCMWWTAVRCLHGRMSVHVEVWMWNSTYYLHTEIVE